MPPEIAKFIQALVAAGLLFDFGEAVIIAKTKNRYRPDWAFLVNVVATRVAHKVYGPGRIYKEK